MNVLTYRRSRAAAWLSFIFFNDSIVTVANVSSKIGNRIDRAGVCGERDFKTHPCLDPKFASDGLETCTGCGFYSWRSFRGSLEIRVKLFRFRYLAIPIPVIPFPLSLLSSLMFLTDVSVAFFLPIFLWLRFSLTLKYTLSSTDRESKRWGSRMKNRFLSRDPLCFPYLIRRLLRWAWSSAPRNTAVASENGQRASEALW